MEGPVLTLQSQSRAAIVIATLMLNACQPIAPESNTLGSTNPQPPTVVESTPTPPAGADLKSSGDDLVVSPTTADSTQPEEINQVQPLSEKDLYDPLAIIRELGQAKDSPEIIPEDPLATQVQPSAGLEGDFPKPPVEDLLPPTSAPDTDTTAIKPATDAGEKTVQVPTTESPIWERLRAGFSLPALPDHREATGHIKGLVENQTALEEFLNKGALYLPFVLSEVEKRQMPLEVALLPYVESGYSPWAVSPMGAMGMWQIMPGTARLLSLKRDNTCDQRRDLIASTRAGLDYLEDLAKRFDGDWMLALAAYNAGPGRVERAVKANQAKKRPIDLWSLKLPRETTRYVPRLLTLRDLIRDADALNLTLPEIPSEISFTTVFLEAPMEVSLAAELSQLSIEEIRRLNPCIRSWITPSHQPYTLLLPTESAGGFASKLVSISVRDYIRTRPYKIVSGDSLSRIAQKVGATVDELKLLNGLTSSRIIAGQTLRIPNTGGSSDSLLALAEGGPGDTFRYKVRSGDSLWEIARRFNTTVNTLKELNNASTLIRPGQWLTVPLN